jgi:hypothetical protein
MLIVALIGNIILGPKPKIDNLDLLKIARKHNIIRFDILVDYVIFVEKGDTVQQLVCNVLDSV